MDGYLQVAAELFDGRLLEADLPIAVAPLPLLTQNLLHELAALAEKEALSQPKRAWAIAAVADAAAGQTDDHFLQGLAAWQLARAANAWVRPQRVEAAVTRACTLFAALNEPGWLAACDWQLNALPWTRPNFKEAAAVLAEALNGLDAAGLKSFVPDCRLSLAYAHLLIGNFEQARELTAASEHEYRAEDNLLGQGRCLLTHASRLRRQSHFAAAHTCLEQALVLFQQLDTPVFIAQAYFQLAYTALASQDRSEMAETRFFGALALFETADLPLWSAQCHGALAQRYYAVGRLQEAGAALRQAREIYAEYEVVGLKADSLLDSGRLELLRGNYALSLDYFSQAESLYDRAGNKWLPIVCLSNQGQVYFCLGFYQRALHYLERAYGYLQTLNIAYRTAFCEQLLAYCWLQLGHFSEVHLFLDKAGSHYKEAQQEKYLYEIYNLRAATLHHENKDREAIHYLQISLSVARQEGAVVEIALSRQLLGELFFILKEYDKVLPHLAVAEESFAEMGLLFEQAACEVALGRYYQQVGDERAAQTAWEQSLTLSAGVLPDIEWQAQAGLAGVASDRDKPAAALAHYRHMAKAMARLRQGLWQPSLAGSFLARPLPHLDAAVRLATQLATDSGAAQQDALPFIEESKAQTVARQLALENGLSFSEDQTTALSDLKAEINWLQEKLRPGFADAPGRPHLADEATLRGQLVEKVKAYDRLQGQFERQQWGAQSEAGAAFSQEQFRQQAGQQLGPNWLALDYYLAGETLCAVLLAPDECRAWQAAVSGPIRLALQAVNSEQYSVSSEQYSVSSKQYARLGEWLLPAWVQERLTPETTLILSPHRGLHRLPWPVLRLGERPLVAAAIPVQLPSLHSLSLLWQRPAHGSPPQGAGLLLAVGEFQGRLQPLPAVSREVALIRALPGVAGQPLRDTAATWGNLQALAGAEGLAARFAFWHLASHAFYDGLSGRFSSVALYDRDVLLDELWQLAPLPALVTLSACSGGHSLVYAGDEHVSLTLTCLAAGAQSVVSSLWPVQDGPMPELMARFYFHWQGGARPSQALALAQREAHGAGLPPAQWGGLQTFGQP
jgi:CHAT domain-containing protein/tetratricopeptide (TPR) repeat protein